MDGFYDFRHVPYAMKMKLPEEAKRKIFKIPNDYKGMISQQVAVVSVHDNWISAAHVLSKACIHIQNI